MSEKKATLRHPAGEHELRQEFAAADRDHDGRVNFSEFRQLLDDLESGMSEREMRIGFAEVDVDRDSLIDCREFMDWWSED